MKANSINNILFRGSQPETVTKPDVKSEVVKSDVATQPQDKAQLKQPLQKDTVEVSTKKPEAKCEGDACKCVGDNCKK